MTWHPDDQPPPQPDPLLWRGITYALMFTAVLTALVVLIVWLANR